MEANTLKKAYKMVVETQGGGRGRGRVLPWRLLFRKRRGAALEMGIFEKEAAPQ
jgi:hypothetical protein